MKRFLICMSLIAAGGAVVCADTPEATAPAATAAPAGKPEGPCKQILAACSGAGFVKGEAKEGKGLFKDCFEPIVHGQSVANVSVDPSLISACQQRMEKHQAKKAAAAAPAAAPAN